MFGFSIIKVSGFLGVALSRNEPLPDDPDGWSVSSSCGPPENFAAGDVWVQGGSPSRTHTAQLLPDNYTGDIDEDLEPINDNLAAK